MRLTSQFFIILALKIKAFVEKLPLTSIDKYANVQLESLVITMVFRKSENIQKLLHKIKPEMKTITKHIVITLSILLSVTISIKAQAQAPYDYKNRGFLRKEVLTVSDFVEGVLKQPEGRNNYGSIKTEFVSWSLQIDEDRKYRSIGEYITVTLRGITIRGFADQAGFESFRDINGEINYQSVYDAIRDGKVMRPTQADVDKNGNPTFYLYDEIGYERYIHVTEIRMSQLINQPLLFIQDPETGLYKPICHMGNGAPIGMNSPQFDFRNKTSGKQQFANQGGISGGNIFLGNDVEEVPSQKVEYEKKAPDLFIFPPENKADVEIKETNNKISDLDAKTAKSFDEQKAKVAELNSELANAFDQIFDQNQKIAGLNTVANNAAAASALAEKTVKDVKAELSEAVASNKTTKEEVALLQQRLVDAEGAVAKVDSQNQELVNSNQGLKYQIKNQEAVYTAEINKWQQRQDSTTQAQKIRDDGQDEKITKVTTRVDALEQNDKRQDADIVTLKKENDAQNKRLDGHDADIIALKKADEEQRAALKVTEQALRTEIANVDTKLTNELKTTNAKLTVVEAEAAKAKKRADDAFSEAQIAKKEASDAKIKASITEKKLEDQILLQKLIDAEQDRKNMLDLQNIKKETENVSKNLDSLKADVKKIKNDQPKLDPEPTDTITKNTGNQKKKVKKNIKYVYGADQTVTIENIKYVEDCPPGTPGCGKGKEPGVILQNPQTGQTIVVAKSKLK